MLKKHCKLIIRVLILFGISVFYLQCGMNEISNVGDPSIPGILRVTLEADPEDTLIVILGDTVIVSDEDSLGIKIYQGKGWAADGSYGILYNSVLDYNQDQFVYNVLKKEAGEYKKYILYESFLPEGTYSSVSTGLEGLHMKIGIFNIPLTQPVGADPIMNFDVTYEVSQGKVTEVNLIIQPLASMTRYLDSYVFARNVQVNRINYLPKSEFDKVVAGLPYIVNPNKPYKP